MAHSVRKAASLALAPGPCYGKMCIQAEPLLGCVGPCHTVWDAGNNGIDVLSRVWSLTDELTNSTVNSRVGARGCGSVVRVQM